MKFMKKLICILLVCFMMLAFTACESPRDVLGGLVLFGALMNSDDSVPKEKIIEFVNKHKEELEKCEENGDFSSFEGVGIVKRVDDAGGYVDFYCGGKGLAAGYSYYCGFFYSASDSPNALKSGDEYYSEKIFDNYYFYEITYY